MTEHLACAEAQTRRGLTLSGNKKHGSRFVVQNIEDDLYCSQLNTSHCFKNLLFAIESRIRRLPSESRLLRFVLIVPSVSASCSYYGWHLKWIVEHALDIEAKEVTAGVPGGQQDLGDFINKNFIGGMSLLHFPTI